MLLRLVLDMIQVTRKLFLHRDPPVLAMAKRAATEVDAEASDRDRSPRGRRGKSMPAVAKAPSPASLAPAVSTRLEGQIAELTRGLQMMGTQLQTLASVVENQQQANAKSQSAIQMQRAMIQSLQAQRTALPISPRGVSRPPSLSGVMQGQAPLELPTCLEVSPMVLHLLVLDRLRPMLQHNKRHRQAMLVPLHRVCQHCSPRRH